MKVKKIINKLLSIRFDSFKFDTRDIWIGLYRDVYNNEFYICPLPTLAFKFKYKNSCCGHYDNLHEINCEFDEWFVDES